MNYGGFISGEGGDIRFTSSSLADRKNLQGRIFKKFYLILDF